MNGMLAGRIQSCSSCGILATPVSPSSIRKKHVRLSLFRILLCASLLLNGVGSAIASTHVALMAAPADHAADVSTAPGVDCPHAAALAADAHAGHAPDSIAPGETDCLELCLDICLQHCHALLAMGTPVPSSSAHALLLVHARVGPASAATFPPIRPPIAA